MTNLEVEAVQNISQDTSYRIDSDEEIYTCELCDNDSPPIKFDLVSFLKHQKLHANDSPYKCIYPGCKKSFKTISDFRAHKRVAHKPRIKISSNHNGIKSTPKTTADYYCNQCNKRFKSVGSLKTHMISHMNLPALPSKYPGSKSPKEVHNVPESISKGVFTCRICSTPHVTWSEFSKHFQKFHGAVPKILLQYKCVPCDLLFQNKQVYLEHNKRSHVSSASLNKSIIKRIRVDPGVSQIKTEKRISSTKVSSSTGAVAFPSKFHHSAFIDNKVSVLKTTSPCVAGGKTQQNGSSPNTKQILQNLKTETLFSRNSGKSRVFLLTRAKSANLQKSTVISTVQATTKPSNNLPNIPDSAKSVPKIQNVLTSIEKKHICPICSRGFKRSDNLKAHARTVHYGVKANNCSACGKGYRTKNELLKHQEKNCPNRETTQPSQQDLKIEFDESLLV